MNGYYEKFKGMNLEDKRDFILFSRERYGVTALSKYLGISPATVYQWCKTLNISTPEERIYYRDKVIPGIGDPEAFMKEYRSKSLDEVKAALKLLDTPQHKTGRQPSSENQSPSDKTDDAVEDQPTTLNDSSVDNHPNDIHTNNLSVSIAGNMSYSDLSKKLQLLFSLLNTNRKYYVELHIRESE